MEDTTPGTGRAMVTLTNPHLYRHLRLRVPRVPAILQHPIFIGAVSTAAVAISILLVGDSLIRRNVLGDISGRHVDDLARFTHALHYSGLDLTSPEARERLDRLSATPEFDTAARRALFGVDAARLDLYSLAGAPLYTTAAKPAHLRNSAEAAFAQARSGRPASLFLPPSVAAASLGETGEVLQTFVLITDQPPDTATAGRSLMVAAISTHVGRELSAAYRTLWWIAGVFTVGLTVIVAIVHWVSLRSRSRLETANRALAAQYAAVRESRERMIRAADDTKRAIAEELHGTVQTKLFAVWMKLGQVRAALPAEAAAQFAELEALTQQVDSIREDDIRGLSHRLHPSIVRVSAAAGLRSLRNFYGEMLPVELEINGAASELEPTGQSLIPEPVRLGVYRIAELALGNVVKHSGAKQCVITWRYEPGPGALILSVRDDGAGFDPAGSVMKGLGMVNIQDYADSIGGEVEIESALGRGATVRVTIPFQMASESDDSSPARTSHTDAILHTGPAQAQSGA